MTVPATAPDSGATEAAGMGALSRLIQEVNDAGMSYAQMAARAVDPETGLTLSKQYFQKIVKTPPSRGPNEPELRAIAEGIRVSPSRVKRAAAEQWMGYKATELSGYDEEVRIIVAHLGSMSPSEVRRWRMMIEADERAKGQE